ncbi:unnamed protein product, partial [marine sediment metagenome]
MNKNIISGNLTSKKDNEKVVDSLESSSFENDTIKFENGNNFIRLAKKLYKAGIIHWIQTGKKSGKAFTCSGSLEKGTYHPADCIL